METKDYIRPVVKFKIVVSSHSIMQTSLNPIKERGFNMNVNGTWDEYDGEEL